MLDTCLEEVGSSCCRLSDRDNAELSIGHPDTGEKGDWVWQIHWLQSPFTSCLSASLQISMWHYVAAESSCFVSLFSPSVRRMLIVWFLGCDVTFVSILGFGRINWLHVFIVWVGFFSRGEGFRSKHDRWPIFLPPSMHLGSRQVWSELPAVRVKCSFSQGRNPEQWKVYLTVKVPYAIEGPIWESFHN